MNPIQTIAQRAPHIQPRIAVVLGSGWGGLTAHLTDAVQIAYTDLPGFPQPTVAGHSATLWLGRLGTQPVAVLGASPGGFGTLLAQNGWLPVLRTLGTRPWFEGRMLVSRAGGLFDDQGNLTDERTRATLADFIAGFGDAIRAG